MATTKVKKQSLQDGSVNAYKLDAGLPVDGQFLTTDSLGNLSWAAGGGGAATTISYEVRNETGSDIPAGSAVYISGGSGSSDHVVVSLASASSEAGSSKTFGITAETILNNSAGLVTLEGIVEGIDTSLFTNGGTLWLGDTPGSIQAAPPPSTPSHAVFVGYAVRIQQNNGSIFVKIQNGYELEELHNVLISNIQDSQFLSWDEVNGYWKNVDAPTGGGGSVTSVQPGTNITIDNTDPANPIINASAGSGSAAQLSDLSDVQTFGYQGYALLPGAGINATSDQATILGYNAAPNATGSNATAFGNSALFSLTTGSGNTAIGRIAQYTVTTSGFNTSVGEGTIINHSGEANVAMGYRAMYKPTAPELASSNNVILGTNAITTASSALTGNVVIGAYANSITGGSDNIRIGNERFTTPVYNIGTGSHKISLGSNQVDGAYVNVAWTVVSDERDKMDFNPVPAGLDFVNKLEPISYYRRKERGKEERAGVKKYGFKAQDILALEGSEPVIVDASNEDQLMYTESNLIPVLVNAIKELTNKVNELENIINNMS